MYNEELELFKKAVAQGFSNRFQRETELCPANAKASKKGKRIAKRIAYSGCTPAEARAHYVKTRYLIALIAVAALLLSSCAVYAYRVEIKSFIEDAFDGHIRLSHEDENTDVKIEQFYTITEIPSGYTLKEGVETPTFAYYLWENSNKHIIKFEQYAVRSAFSILDTENGNIDILDYNGLEIAHEKNDEKDIYTWNNNTYVFIVSLTQGVDVELFDLIGSVKPK